MNLVGLITLETYPIGELGSNAQFRKVEFNNTTPRNSSKPENRR